MTGILNPTVNAEHEAEQAARPFFKLAVWHLRVPGMESRAQPLSRFTHYFQKSFLSISEEGLKKKTILHNNLL